MNNFPASSKRYFSTGTNSVLLTVLRTGTYIIYFSGMTSFS
jgi:hypothetical protein